MTHWGRTECVECSGVSGGVALHVEHLERSAGRTYLLGLRDALAVLKDQLELGRARNDRHPGLRAEGRRLSRLPDTSQSAKIFWPGAK